MKTIRLGEATRNFPHRQAFALAVAAAVGLLFGPLTANATTYYSTYGQSRTETVTLTASGTHTFEVDRIASYKYTEWYVNTGAGYVYKETDNSGLLAIDPDYSYTFSSGTTAIKAIVYNSDWSVRESHIWNVSVQTIISAYWLTPVYVTEGTVVTMRAQVTGFSIGDQFSFDIYEDDYPFGSAYVTTKFGTVYSSGSNLYVGATWTSVWQSDQSGDPEFYCIVSRGSVSKESSRADANEMHVARGPVLSRSPSGLSQTITQGQNAPSQSFEVWNSGGGTLSYSISDNSTWLSVGTANGNSTGEHDAIQVNYATTGLAAGVYNATITITASGASGSPQTVGVTLTVNPPPQTIISAYWLTPNYVTEGAVGTMRAQVSGYNVGDQFAFEIREDDGALGYDYVTTKYGNVTSSGGSLWVEATWTTVWQSDQSGDPEFYFVVSRGGASLSSSTVDANEMHVARGPVLSRSPSSLTQSVTQGQNAGSQSFEVWDSGGGTLNYTINDDATWLSVGTANGNSTGEHDTIQVNYATSGLAAGVYNATITITASGASGSPQTVGVTLTVNPPPQTIINAYWLTPNYVTEGTVGTMRAQVSGYSVGDQFSFEIREDDSPLGSDYVTTKTGNVTSSGGSLWVEATWATVWQSDQSGDPEFYFVVSRGGTSRQSSTADADEMHVAQGEHDDQISEAIPLGSMTQTRMNSGSIDSPTDVDIYSFSVTAGQRISFDIDRPSGALAAYLRVFDGSGNELPLAHNSGGTGPGESAGTEAYLEYTFPSAGTFYVGVSGVSNNSYNPVSGTGDGAGSTGAYRLVVSPGLAGVGYRPNPGIYFQVDVLRAGLEPNGPTWRVVHGKSAIDPTMRTWIVIHGRDSSRDSLSISNVTYELLQQQPADQVLTVDWSQGSYASALLDFAGEDAIQSVGIWARNALLGAGFTGSKLNLVGHSWGSYVADELAERMPGGVNTIVVLDPAADAPIAFSYDPNAPGEIDFGRDSLFSWAFHSSNYGSDATPFTADEAFIVTGGRDGYIDSHTDVVFLFAYMLAYPNDLVSQYFLLSYLLAATPGRGFRTNMPRRSSAIIQFQDMRQEL